MKQLYKNKSKEKVCGVCAGLSEVFQIDVSIVRIVTAILCLGWGLGIILYIIMAIVLPDKSELGIDDNTFDATYFEKEDNTKL